MKHVPPIPVQSVLTLIFTFLLAQPHLHRFISCTLYPVKRYVAVSYLLSFLYDTLITVLSISGLISSTQNRQATLTGPNSSFLRRIILGNGMYFVALILLSLSSGILPLVTDNPYVIAVLYGPHTTVTVCMSLKIFRHLRSSVVNPKVNPNRVPGGSGSVETPKEVSCNRSTQFGPTQSPVYKISRSEELSMRALENKSGDLESLTENVVRY